MPAPRTVTSIDELLALPHDGLRHELLDGEHVVTPAPSLVHQLVLGRLYDALRPALGDGPLRLLWSPADVHLGPRTLVQPDLFVAALPDPGAARTWREVPPPALAIEVLSSSTAWRDRVGKRRIYLEAGVEEYWIVDVDARLIERWRVGDEKPEILDHELHWALRGGAAGVVGVAQLFAGLGGEVG